MKAFPSEVTQLLLVHVLDLAPEGWIKPHVDSIRVIKMRFYILNFRNCLL